MGKIGEYPNIDLPAGARRDLTVAIRQCREATGLSLRELEREYKLGRHAWHALLRGETKRPDVGVLEWLHARAEQEFADEQVKHIPSLERILELRDQVCLEASDPLGCRSCGRPWNDASVASGPEGISSLRGSASPGVPYEAWDTKLPVPRSAGDRQHRWHGSADLEARLEAERYDDAAGILRHVGESGTADEVATAIADCHAGGLAEVARDLATYAARRSADEVIEVLRALLDAGDVEGAKELAAMKLEKR